MRERTMNLKMYSRALRVRRMGSHCSPRLDTSRYFFNTDINFLGEKDMEETEEGDRKKGKRKSKFKKKKMEMKEINHSHSARIVIVFLMFHRFGKLITNSIFHSHRAERQSATE